MSQPVKLKGVSRIGDAPNALLLYFDGRPSDNAMRAIQDVLRDMDFTPEAPVNTATDVKECRLCSTVLEPGESELCSICDPVPLADEDAPAPTASEGPSIELPAVPRPPAPELELGPPLRDSETIPARPGTERTHDGYEVLSRQALAAANQAAERPYRDRYTHLECRGNTGLGWQIASTFQAQPSFYTHTWCSHCKNHFPVSEFRWALDNTEVGK